MGVPYPGVVNIVTLIVSFFFLILSTFVCIRHGLGRSTPWVCLIIFSLCRLTQVSLDLAATQLYTPRIAANSSLESGVAILTELGLTPLFMATSSLLNTTTRPKGRKMQWLLMLLHVPLIVSLILIVAGGIDPDSREGPSFAATEATKAGVALYCLCFVILIWATAVISARLYLADKEEVKILTTVVLSLPFFLVDVVYMMCFAFESLAGGYQRFNVIAGNVTLQLTMQVIMEFIVVGLYLGLGLELPSKAARVADRVAHVDPDELTATLLWKLYELGSDVVVYIVMPSLRFSHWLLGRILRS